MLTQEDVLKTVNIKERLLRFWIKEYSLRKFVLSRKNGNLYNEEILFYLKTVKFLKDTDIFTTKAIKKIVKELKKEKKEIHELGIISEISDKFRESLYSEPVIERIPADKEDETTGNNEEEYIHAIMKAENLISHGDREQAVEILEKVSINSELYGRIAYEMLEMIRNDI